MAGERKRPGSAGACQGARPRTRSRSHQAAGAGPALTAKGRAAGAFLPSRRVPDTGAGPQCGGLWAVSARCLLPRAPCLRVPPAFPRKPAQQSQRRTAPAIGGNGLVTKKSASLHTNSSQAVGFKVAICREISIPKRHSRSSTRLAPAEPKPHPGARKAHLRGDNVKCLGSSSQKEGPAHRFQQHGDRRSAARPSRRRPLAAALGGPEAGTFCRQSLRRRE